MAGSLLSTSWYRVADRRPRLRSHAQLHRHRYRGELWYLLQDPASSRVHRFTPAARLIIALMDGTRTVAQLWEIANRRLGEAAPTQDEMIQLLGQLHAADLLQSDVTPDVAELFARGEREERARSRRSYANPMALRLPLWDPDALLDRFEPAIRTIWSRWGAALWLLVVLPALFLVWPHFPELANNFSDRVLAVDNLVVLYLCFPVLKALHELGHATATKAGGGEVHDMGIIVLVLLPVPYVEASAATVFRSKYRRAMVGAAGVTVELFVAALAFYAWLLVEPGLFRAVLFNVMLIASVSTLIFNGNPLLRYDAYYILADLIEIPNLALRSGRYWGYLLERYVLGLDEAEPPEASRAERAWFLFYGFAATCYRFLVTVFIALFIANRFYVIGVLLALWAVAAMAVYPVIRAVRHVTSSPRLRRHRTRAIALTAGIPLVVMLFLVVIPMPSHSNAEGVLWLPEEAIVRSGGNGFVETFLVEPGTRVAAGTALIRLADPALASQVDGGAAKVAELEAEYNAAFATDRAKAQIVHDKLDAERASLALLRERADELVVRARIGGVFTVPRTVDVPGRYYKKGELLGYVIGQVEPLTRVVVSQDAIDRVRLRTAAVELRLAEHPSHVLAGRVVREVPAGEATLPSPALSATEGGDIATDPRDPKAPRALQRVFQVDVALDGVSPFGHFGQRVFVRFDHHREPLAEQWYRSIRLLFLTTFNV